jgi:hypothetical protein
MVRDVLQRLIRANDNAGYCPAVVIDGNNAPTDKNAVTVTIHLR